MPRPRIEPGAWGEVSLAGSDGRYVARARFRTAAGALQLVERSGRSKTAARTALEKELRRRAEAMGTNFTAGTTVREAARAWWDEWEKGERPPSTRDNYRRAYVTITAAIGGLSLREVTTGRLDKFLTATAAVSPSRANTARIVLTHVFNEAVRNDALTRSPVEGTRPIAAERGEVRALTLEEAVRLRRKLREWVAVAGRGRGSAFLLPDVVDVLLGTGLRISEALGMRWVDTDLGSAAPSVSIVGQIERVPRKGLRWVERTKTKTSKRTVYVPPFVVEVLLRRRIEGTANRHGLVFTTANGEIVDKKTLERLWRECRDAIGFEWVTSRVFRKSVATSLAEGGDLQRAAQQLGHAGTGVTDRHYVAHTNTGPAEAAEILQRFAGDDTDE